MNGPSGRLSEALRRLLPFFVTVAIATCGYLWFVQPRLGAYLRTRTDVSALRGRVRTLQVSTERARAPRPVDMQASLTEFEARVSRDDTVADVTAALANAVLDSAPADSSSEVSRFLLRRAGRGGGRHCCLLLPRS